MLKAYTDGSSKANGKPHCTAGWAFVVERESDGFLFIRYGHLSAPSSNNRGEIMGVLYGLLKFPDIAFQFYSDSRYVQKSIMEWRFKHERNGYDGIKNMDLLLPLYTEWDRRSNCEIHWVKGHAGHKGNELADTWCGYGGRNEDRSIKNEFCDIQMVTEEEIQGLLNERKN